MLEVRQQVTKSKLPKILWVTFLVFDAQLHKTSQLEVLENLGKIGFKTKLMGVQSKSKFQHKMRFISIIPVPLRNKPLITSSIFSVLIFLLLPFYILFTKPDFVIIQPTIPITSFIPILPICRVTKTKVILDIRTIIVQSGVRASLHQVLFSSAILVAKKLFDGITIITDAMKKELCEKYSLDTNKVGVWSSGVSPSLFNSSNFQTSSELRDKLGLKEKFIVFYHGALSTDRGLVETVNAIKIVRQRHPEVSLFLLGSGSMVNTLRDLIEEEKLHNNVFIHNAVEYEDVPKFISMSDVAIIPLPDMHFWRSQSPLKLLEYLAMKKTVIISNLPAHRAVIGDKRCGIFLSSVTPDSIAESIIYAIQNKDKLPEWGKVGREIIQQGFTWQNVAADLGDYLLSIS
jgi:glycosyltransferase involved in cell wall biosynthesis